MSFRICKGKSTTSYSHPRFSNPRWNVLLCLVSNFLHVFLVCALVALAKCRPEGISIKCIHSFNLFKQIFCKRFYENLSGCIFIGLSRNCRRFLSAKTIQDWRISNSWRKPSKNPDCIVLKSKGM